MEKQEIRTFGRRFGKTLSTRQRGLINNLLPVLSPKNIKTTGKQIILEIGFGGGEHLQTIARQFPDVFVIGAEPFINGVASLLAAMTNESDNTIKDDAKNIRIWPDDVRQILNPGSDDFIPLLFSHIFVLHPDPWPKKRHEKRRLLNASFLNLLAARLDAGGQIIIGTDHWEYYDWILEQLKQTSLKINTNNLDVIETRYQHKNKSGTSGPKYLVLSNH